MRFALTALVLLLTCSTASAETIAGRASVIDGDTIEIHGERIRILDIDAPESRQTCTADGGTEWRCGREAAFALDALLKGKTVSCETDRKDRYGRWLARCRAQSDDIAEWMAGHGWAVPYRDCGCATIRAASAFARSEHVGIWSSVFVMPWEWRAQQAEQPVSQPTIVQPAQSSDSAACQIKGNVSSKGERIYHVPGGKGYDATKIDVSKGERWFCSEADARAAGWRPAKQ